MEVTLPLRMCIVVVPFPLLGCLAPEGLRVSHGIAAVFLVGDVLKFDLNLTIFLRARSTKSIFGKVNKEKEVAFRPDSQS